MTWLHASRPCRTFPTAPMNPTMAVPFWEPSCTPWRWSWWWNALDKPLTSPWKLWSRRVCLHGHELMTQCWWNMGGDWSSITPCCLIVDVSITSGWWYISYWYAARWNHAHMFVSVYTLTLAHKSFFTRISMYHYLLRGNASPHLCQLLTRYVCNFVMITLILLELFTFYEPQPRT